MLKPRAKLLAVLISAAASAVAPKPALADDLAVTGHDSLPGWSSCSNTNCHGAASGPVFRQSFGLWASRDPHAGAYWVLFGDESRRMVGKLSPRTTQGHDYRDYVDKHCAVCHASLISSDTSADDEAPEFTLASPDVGCSSCHGDATNWLEDHFKPSAQEKSVAVLTDQSPQEWTSTNHHYGLSAMDDEVTRARACVGCHVGSAGGNGQPRREVNHDLIAAGHPRLAFEYTSHLANLPRHWSETQHELDPAAAAVKQWTIGQLVAADAALELLIARTQSGVWPEYSEYHCAGCHHSLAGKDHDHGTLQPQGRTGYAWGSWYFALPQVPVAQRQPMQDQIQELASAMSPLIPDREIVRQQAAVLQQQLRAELSAQEEPIAAPKEDAQRMAARPRDWDAAVQQYLWLAHTSAGLGGDRPQLDRLYRVLALPPGQNGPTWPNRWRTGFADILDPGN